MIKIDFEIETKIGKYSDALYLDDNHGLTYEQIELMKQQRADYWVKFVEKASAEVNIPTEPPVLPELLFDGLVPIPLPIILPE